jgi:hypothetical protein
MKYLSTVLRRPHQIRTITYWIFTLLVAYENAAGAMWTVTQLEYMRAMLAHLGYPPYFSYILGPWQLACAATLLAPRLPRVKEWAYAGAFFNYSSAIASHLFVGDAPQETIGAAVMAVFTVLSWALRPADRRLTESKTTRETTGKSWIAAAVILSLMLALWRFSVPPISKH